MTDQQPGQAPRAGLSAAVVSYNREAIIGTCLKALAFADEIVVIDKSSTDQTSSIAARLADRVVTVPWSPTVEDTRAFAVAQCRHEWVLLLDDDECLSPDAIAFIEAELAAPRADIYALPLRHYVLGTHDERAYYWPEAHYRLFRRAAVGFEDVVHSGVRLLSERRYSIPIETGACLHHLSHADAAQWIEKTNRYTSQAARIGVPEDGGDIIEYARGRLDHWASQGSAEGRTGGDGYVAAVAALRAVYDIVDRVKAWEQARGQPGADLFARQCAELERATAELLEARPGLNRVGLRRAG